VGRNKGICTLCGKGGPLTFEHVPAEASGNPRGGVMYNLEEWLARDAITGVLPGGVPLPEGMGVIGLCGACNNGLLNVHYVPAFVDFVEAGKQMIGDIGATRFAELDTVDKTTCASVKFLAVNRLAVAKQIISMVLVTSGREVVAKNSDLEKFVRTPTARCTPAKYRLFLALTAGSAARSTGLSVQINASGEAHFAEVVHPPFAYALSFNATAPYPDGEISHWTAAEYDSICEEAIGLPIGYCHTIIPGDLRTSAHIERETRESSP
jgi:hypothetical protein